MLTFFVAWAAFTVGFFAGCALAGRNRSGIRERDTDRQNTDATRHVVQAVSDRLAVERLLRSL